MKAEEKATENENLIQPVCMHPSVKEKLCISGQLGSFALYTFSFSEENVLFYSAISSHLCEKRKKPLYDLCLLITAMPLSLLQLENMKRNEEMRSIMSMADIRKRNALVSALCAYIFLLLKEAMHVIMKQYNRRACSSHIFFSA